MARVRPTEPMGTEELAALQVELFGPQPEPYEPVDEFVGDPEDPDAVRAFFLANGAAIKANGVKADAHHAAMKAWRATKTRL
jgi:hypothetical protein